MSPMEGHQCPPNLIKEHKKEPVGDRAAHRLGKQRFGLNSVKARDWNEALAKRELGCLDDYDVTETMQGEPEYAMPYMFPPTSEAE